jgi:signal transduction histidine kinase/CheY-like chemotaxis protein
MSKIFISFITLKFKNLDYEEQYAKTLTEKLNIKNIIYCLIIISVLFIFDLIYWEMDKQDDLGYKMTKISTLIHTLIVFVLLILTVSFPKAAIIQRIIIYINFILLIFFEVNIRYFFVIILKTDPIIISMIILIQYLFILTFYYNKMLDFFIGSLLLFAKAIIYYCFYSTVFPLSIHYRFGIYQLMNIIICSVSFFYVYECRKSFYYYKVAETSRLWYHNILENMNTGFLSLSNTKVAYVNKSLMNLFDLVKSEVPDEYAEVREKEDDDVCRRDLIYSIIDEIFKNTKLEEDDNDFGFGLEKMKKYLKLNSRNTFINLGICSLVGSRINPIQFQIHGRYYTSHSSKGLKENFDFLFNDISGIKLNEQINAEFKYKSMFLSKVAHEFKNPILCIADLAEQVKENLEACNDLKDISNEIKKIHEILAGIKSMSDYLLILIKDMDYFSMKTNTNRKLSIDNDVINVRNFLSFIEDITKILIKKFNKENSICFEIQYNYLPKEIISDEIKLKQILINLLSNGIKYTLHGKVILDLLFFNDNELQIKVIDTGKGIHEEKVKNLFQPFIEQNREFNYISAGLGLNIVKDIVGLLGSNIVYEPNKPEGSIFRFTVKVEVINNIQSNIRSSESNEIDVFEEDTIVLEFNPIIPRLNDSLNDIPERQNNSPISDNLEEVNPLNEKIIIVVDDEIMTRKSTIRLINDFCKAKGIAIRILECSDGIECLWYYYQNILKGEKIALILSDETMMIMNGLYSANILSELCKLRGLPRVPFFIVTAYESLQHSTESVVQIFSKPLTKKNLQKAFVHSSILQNN